MYCSAPKSRCQLKICTVPHLNLAVNFNVSHPGHPRHIKVDSLLRTVWGSMGLFGKTGTTFSPPPRSPTLNLVFGENEVLRGSGQNAATSRSRNFCQLYSAPAQKLVLRKSKIQGGGTGRGRKSGSGLCRKKRRKTPLPPIVENCCQL